MQPVPGRGMYLDHGDSSEDCYSVEPAGGPPEIYFMIVSGRVVRLDIPKSGV